MKKYELLLILPGTLDEKEAETRAAEVHEMVKQHSGETNFHLLGKNRLAYPIKQIRYGYFYVISLEAETVKLKELEKKLALERDILRAVVSRYNPKAAEGHKISYATDSLGMSNIVEYNRDKEEEKASIPQPRVEAKKVNLEEIDKKLDEILQGDIMPGV